MDAEPSHYQCRVEYSFHVRPSYLMRPLKPMKAIDMRPAVTRAIGSPRMQARHFRVHLYFLAYARP